MSKCRSHQNYLLCQNDRGCIACVPTAWNVGDRHELSHSVKLLKFGHTEENEANESPIILREVFRYSRKSFKRIMFILILVFILF